MNAAAAIAYGIPLTEEPHQKEFPKGISLAAMGDSYSQKYEWALVLDQTEQNTAHVGWVLTHLEFPSMYDIQRLVNAAIPLLGRDAIRHGWIIGIDWG